RSRSATSPRYCASSPTTAGAPRGAPGPCARCGRSWPSTPPTRWSGAGCWCQRWATPSGSPTPAASASGWTAWATPVSAGRRGRSLLGLEVSDRLAGGVHDQDLDLLAVGGAGQRHQLAVPRGEDPEGGLAALDQHASLAGARVLELDAVAVPGLAGRLGVLQHRQHGPAGEGVGRLEPVTGGEHAQLP